MSMSSGHKKIVIVGGFLAKSMRLTRSGGGLGSHATSCIEARGIKAESLVEGAHKSTMDELAAWTQEADKVLVF
jgi:uncharacterized protein involved in oxidation of intracellular sulfur